MVDLLRNENQGQNDSKTFALCGFKVVIKHKDKRVEVLTEFGVHEGSIPSGSNKTCNS